MKVLYKTLYCNNTEKDRSVEFESKNGMEIRLGRLRLYSDEEMNCFAFVDLFCVCSSFVVGQPGRLLLLWSDGTFVDRAEEVTAL